MKAIVHVSHSILVDHKLSMDLARYGSIIRFNDPRVFWISMRVTSRGRDPIRV